MYRFWLKNFKNIIRTITFFPVVLPIVAVGQLFRKIYEIQPNYGLLNSLLNALGLKDMVQAWIGQASTALQCLSVMDIWVSIGFYAVIFYGGLLDISEDVIEAAKIDGASSWKMFKNVLFPLLRPITITCLVFSFAGTVKMFESAISLTNGGPGNATTSLSMYMYNVAFEYHNYGYGSAIAIVVFLICILGTQIIKRFDVKEM
jgi:raffinose/stachyose/melibiose transport system permease protein